MTLIPADTDVLIVGAGPVGLTLAVDLGLRGVRCMLVEKKPVAAKLPKMERCNARSMEIFRRLGIADRIRDAGYPRAYPMDVYFVTSLTEPPIHRNANPSVTELKNAVAGRNDGVLPLEPYQLISQYVLEPLLREIAEEFDSVDVHFGTELLSIEQDEHGVSARVQAGDAVAEIRAAYLVGCDGGTSTVRKQLGIELNGRAAIRSLWQALFRCEEFYDRLPIGHGRHYYVADEHQSVIVCQSDTRHFSLHSEVEHESELPAVFARALGAPIPFEMVHAARWSHHLLCAERLSCGRVFLAGDAAHLVIPTGGLGMNTGIGDAHDLAWKLAGTLAGWGGPALLAAYDTERRQVALRNIRASGNATDSRDDWRRRAYTPALRDDTPAGAAARAAYAEHAATEQGKNTVISGMERGYRYVGSPLICEELGEPPDLERLDYVPTTWPGSRVPHAWTAGGSALQDLAGRGYTLIRFGPPSAGAEALESAMRATRAPFQTLGLAADDPARAVLGRDLLLLRPDLHVAWRGNDAPADSQHLARVATGFFAEQPAVPAAEVVSAR